MAIKTHFSDGDNYELRQVIFANTPKAIEQCKSIAQKFKGVTEIDTCKNIFDFLKNDIRYIADGGHQKVKLPSALLREKVGDCKSYSLFTGAILSNLGIGWKYVLVSFREDPTPTHIYVVTDSGIIIDAVYGTFNKEKKPIHKFYHKPDNMKISTISGIGSDPLKQRPATVQQQRVQIGNLDRQGICALNSKAFIGAPRAYIWFRNSRGRDATTSEQLAWGTKAALNSIARNIVLELFKANAGGISTMLFDLCFKKENTVYTIPQSEFIELGNKLGAYAKQIGYKVPDPRQRQAIQTLTSRSQTTVDASSSTTSNVSFNVTNFDVSKVAKDMVEKSKAIYEQIMGAGQYPLYVKFLQFEAAEKNKIIAKYSVFAPNPKASKLYNDFENQWWNMGGDPWDINDAIQEGAKKSPRGKLFNYVIGIIQTRGLTFKDTPLLIRAIINSVTGDKFSLDESGSYVMGKGVGIGVVDWAAISANIKVIGEILSGLLGLFLLFKSAFGKGDENGNGNDTINDEEGKKLAWYLSNGYMIKQDAIDAGAPVPYLEELTVDGEVVVKPEEAWFKKKYGGSDLAGFGSLALPLLIGVGAILALNAAGKQK